MSKLKPGVVQDHLLLGIPAQLHAAYDDQLFDSDSSLTAVTAPELVSKATLSDNAQVLLRHWLENADEFSAMTLAFKLKCEGRGCEQLVCKLVEEPPDCHISTYTDGSVKYPESSFIVDAFGVFLPLWLGGFYAATLFACRCISSLLASGPLKLYILCRRRRQ